MGDSEDKRCGEAGTAGRRHDERYEGDPTPSREVARRYREAIRDDEADVGLALVHYRGGEEEFLLGKEYSGSGDAGDRATGADILAQLGWGDGTYQEESVAILMELLEDADPLVIHSAAVGLGHRGAEEAIPALVGLAGHADALVRYGVVYGLTGHEDGRAIAAMIRLAADGDHDVRNWAVFGLGSQMDADTPEIREALRQALADEDHEIRGEALVGLAKRGDATIVSELRKEWLNERVSILSIEAAEEAADPRLHGDLKAIAGRLNLDEDVFFAGRLEDAIQACAPKEGGTDG